MIGVCGGCEAYGVFGVYEMYGLGGVLSSAKSACASHGRELGCGAVFGALYTLYG